MSGVLSPSFVADLESRMRVIATNEYDRLVARMHWPRFMKSMQSKSKREVLFWLLETAQIEITEEGNVSFEDLMIHQTEFKVEYASKGLRLVRSKFEDLANGVNGGEGIQIASGWTRQITAQSTYWPEEKAYDALKLGTSKTGYDGQPFFSAAHPVNVFDTSLGTYKNLWTDAASTGGTLGVMLDDRHDLATAFRSFSEIRAAIASIPMANGTQPRKLKPLGFICPPRMTERLVLLGGARFIGMDGSTDVATMAKLWGLEPPMEAEELGAAYGGSDTDCYLVTQDITGDSLGGLTYVDREPFAIRYYTGHDGASTGLDAILNRARELEWHVQGRNVVGYGHPYLIHKLVGQAPPPP